MTPAFRPAPARLAPGRRIYAVGDVHGCADRLLALHAAIGRDLADRPVADATLLHVGDYIDRGPDSARVVETLIRGPALPAGVRVVNLMGNHEWMMLAAVALGDADDVAVWLENGGGETLRSWGVNKDAPVAHWPDAVPRDHLLAIRDLAFHHVQDGYLFVHAGVRPEVPLDRQTRHDLLWTREPFLSWDVAEDGPLLPDSALVVVHGHTPQAGPTVSAHRIGIDTGAVRGGALTCAVLEEDRVGFMSA